MKLGNAAQMSRRMNFIRIIMIEMTKGNHKKVTFYGALRFSLIKPVVIF